MIVLPGGEYAEHAAHEAEPVASWLSQLGVHASVFRYPHLGTAAAAGDRRGRGPSALWTRRCPGPASRISATTRTTVRRTDNAHIGPPRVFRTAELELFHAARCQFRYSS
jgi:hypothetical protein